MNEENPIGYYAVIPSPVLFNEDLKPNEKLLYAVITILANKDENEKLNRILRYGLRIRVEYDII